MIKQINHIAIVVEDMERALGFWRDALGLRRGAIVVVALSDRVALGLAVALALALLTGHGPGPGRHGGQLLAHPGQLLDGAGQPAGGGRQGS